MRCSSSSISHDCILGLMTRALYLPPPFPPGFALLSADLTLWRVASTSLVREAVAKRDKHARRRTPTRRSLNGVECLCPCVCVFVCVVGSVWP